MKLIPPSQYSSQVILLDIPEDQMPYLSEFDARVLSEVCNDARFYFCTRQSKRAHEATLTVSSNVETLRKLAGDPKIKTLEAYAGTVIGNTLFIQTLKHIFVVPTYRFTTVRFIRKFLNPTEYHIPTRFTWTAVNNSNIGHAEYWLSNCVMQSWDIETVGDENYLIDLVGISGLAKDGTVLTFVFSGLNMRHVEVLRRIAQSDSAKTGQNMLFDNSHLLRYNIILKNWLYDTFAMFTCWFSELPRSLGFISAFCLVGVRYWKSDFHSTNRVEFMRYNARDAWATLHVTLAILKEWPQWAAKNYSIQFPKYFPALLMNMTGLDVDAQKREALTEQMQQEAQTCLTRLRTMLATPNFNPGSPKQMVSLLHLLGNKDLKSSDEASLVKARMRHPLNAKVIDLILQYRKCTKLVSTYLTKDLIGGKLYYTLNPFGADTGRWACSKSVFGVNVNRGTGRVGKWTKAGFQVQNIPPIIKTILKAPEGFKLYEPDGSAIESRCTAYLAQELTMIDAVENQPDFHKFNASKFFGVPIAEVSGELRNLAKRPNHGFNYNMSSFVLLGTMGETHVATAKRLLQLPSSWDLRHCCLHLLMSVAKTYPRLKGTKYTWLVEQRNVGHSKAVAYLHSEKTYYGEIITQVEKTHLLTSPLGWTRYCFGSPSLRKADLNEYAAHPSQNLGVQLIDRGIMRIYGDPELRHEIFETGDLRLIAQIHDSFPFALRNGKEHLAEKIVAHLPEDVEVHGRILRVPFVVGEGKEYWK